MDGCFLGHSSTPDIFEKDLDRVFKLSGLPSYVVASFFAIRPASHLAKKSTTVRLFLKRGCAAHVERQDMVGKEAGK